MSDVSRRILPEAMEGDLRRLPGRLTGAGLIAAAISAYASLITWSHADPSFNHITSEAPRNALGAPGAIAADLLMQSAGLGAIALLLPPLIWGFNLVKGAPPKRAPVRLFYWAGASLLIAGGLSALPAPQGWPLGQGLGGVAGDMLAKGFIRIGGIIEPGFATAIGAALASIAGLLALLRAIEWSVRDILAVFGLGARPEPEPFGMFTEPFEAQTKIISRATSWRRRFPAMLGRALVKKEAAPPREFWMRERSALGGIAHAAESLKAKIVAAIAKPAPQWEREETAAEPDFGSAPEGLGARIEPHFGPLLEEGSPPGGGETLTRSEAPYRMRRGAGPAAAAGPEVKRGAQTANTSAADNFALPPIKLLSDAPKPSGEAGPSDEMLRERAAGLEAVLDDFGVKGRIARVHPGPVITLYELEPARGTKSSRVIGLADDIARSMSATAARVAVIPGRDALGIELPNDKRETVHLRQLFQAEAFQKSEAKLALALGKTIAGQPMIADLAKMPHLLIAGTTGSGKSVGINAMILSLLYRLSPSQCRFIMIDPKMLELSVYDGIPHLLTPVVTDPKKAVAALKWTVNEMNGRYERMCKLGVRNIGGYNQKVLHAQLRQSPLTRTVSTGFDPLTGAPVYESEDAGGDVMPYIVVVIDEMADLMMVAGKEIEYCVMRLAQMARAAGIHVIMATQRPSVDVITGTIKANFPSRISYQVTSKIDSRTILGEQGAEQLLGAGDMLYMAPGGRISRAHGPFVSDGDVEKVAAFLRSQGAPDYLHAVAEAMEAESGEAPGEAGAGNGGGSDKLYDDAVAIVLADKRPTTSYLQRRLGIGYNRAASLIERMEEDGLISAPNRTGKRDVLTGAN